MDFFLKPLLINLGKLLFLPLTLVVSASPVMPSGQTTMILTSPTPTASASANPSTITLAVIQPSKLPEPTIFPKISPSVIYLPTPVPSPVPTPLPSPIIVTSQQLDDWFTTYSNQFSVDRQKLWNIAVCESGLNPNVRNGDYGGLYQFATHTWQTTRTAMNLDSNPDLRFNPEEAIKTAAFKIATGGLSSWPNCSK
jgi:hypothetical protein